VRAKLSRLVGIVELKCILAVEYVFKYTLEVVAVCSRFANFAAAADEV
jgi:hypothetical protein